MAVILSSFSFCLLLFSLLVTPPIAIAGVFAPNGVLSVKSRYAGLERSLSQLKAHDSRRQLRILTGVDLPLGGSGRPAAVGLYYAKIGIGTPPKEYYVQVDTGSDIMWVNCIQCTECPSRSSLGIELTLYNIDDSETGKLVPCNKEFCLEINGGTPLSGCMANMSCPYIQIYGDGSSTAGYAVNDVLHYDLVSGDLKTTSSNGSVMFGCGARQSGDLGSSSEEALDGILGFGKSNTSIISQLASSGKVKKMFAHCLDGTNGGGIFAIGRVVQPKVNMTPLVPNQPHYSINMTAVQVGHVLLNVSKEVFEVGDKRGTIIDSGTTLAYLPEMVYEPLVSKIISQQADLKVHTVHDEYTCFQYSESVDDGFPPVTFYFENSLFLKVYPREYLFPYEGLWCIGWQNSGMQSRDSMNLTLFGDLVLSNKLVLYDLENQAIGWTEYNWASQASFPLNLYAKYTIKSLWCRSEADLRNSWKLRGTWLKKKDRRGISVKTEPNCNSVAQECIIGNLCARWQWSWPDFRRHREQSLLSSIVGKDLSTRILAEELPAAVDYFCVDDTATNNIF